MKLKSEARTSIMVLSSLGSLLRGLPEDMQRATTTFKPAGRFCFGQAVSTNYSFFVTEEMYTSV